MKNIKHLLLIASVIISLSPAHSQCTANGMTYAIGTTVCIDGKSQTCAQGGWVDNNSACNNAEAVSRAQNCIYNGQTYSQGAVVCMNGWEYRCTGDGWDYLGTQCGNTVTQTKTDATKSSSKILKIEFSSDAKAKLMPCTSFFSTGSLSQFGIRNNCAECKVAVVSWAGVGVRGYNVNGYSSIVVDILSSYGQLIGENPCH